jgi:hypothetical protein
MTWVALPTPGANHGFNSARATGAMASPTTNAHSEINSRRTASTSTHPDLDVK